MYTKLFSWVLELDNYIRLIMNSIIPYSNSQKNLKESFLSHPKTSRDIGSYLIISSLQSFIPKHPPSSSMTRLLISNQNQDISKQNSELNTNRINSPFDTYEKANKPDTSSKSSFKPLYKLENYTNSCPTISIKSFSALPNPNHFVKNFLPQKSPIESKNHKFTSYKYFKPEKNKKKFRFNPNAFETRTSHQYQEQSKKKNFKNFSDKLESFEIGKKTMTNFYKKFERESNSQKL
jgi:hypothetical protein